MQAIIIKDLTANHLTTQTINLHSRLTTLTMPQAPLGPDTQVEARSNFLTEIFPILLLEDDMEGTRIASSPTTYPSESAHERMEVPGRSESVTNAETLCWVNSSGQCQACSI